MPSAPLQVAAVDIGAKENIGWAIDGAEHHEGKDIEACITGLADALEQGPLALGFEAPMFVPLHQDSSNLTRARRGEGNRPFSFGAGPTALTSALVVVPYILKQLHARLPTATVSFDWTKLPTVQHSLILFEAFVTNQYATDDDDPHIRDAKLAIAKFQDGLRDGFKSAIEEPICFNLLAAALLRTGWNIDPDMLSQPCLVVMDRGARGSRFRLFSR
jgi:hypothetical protein